MTITINARIFQFVTSFGARVSAMFELGFLLLYKEDFEQRGAPYNHNQPTYMYTCSRLVQMQMRGKERSKPYTDLRC